MDLINNKDINYDLNKNSNLIKFNLNNLIFKDNSIKIESYFGLNSENSRNSFSILPINYNINYSTNIFINNIVFKGFSLCQYESFFINIKNIFNINLFNLNSFSNYFFSLNNFSNLFSSFFKINFPLMFMSFKIAYLDIFYNYFFFYKKNDASISYNANTSISDSNYNSINSFNNKNTLKLRYNQMNYLKFKYDYKNGNYLPDLLTDQFNFLNLSKINISNNKRFNS
jgi:hypothetical protein